jgi:uncharacterized protein YkwD
MSAPRLSAALVVGCLIPAACPAVAPAARPHDCAGVSQPIAETGPSAAARGVRCLINNERSRHERRRLRPQLALTAGAAAHAGDMVEHGFFGHASSTGLDLAARVAATGYGSAATPTVLLGENIAWGSGLQATPSAVVRSWMRSPEHRASILRTEFREFGVAVVPGTPLVDLLDGATFTVIFGTRET